MGRLDLDKEFWHPFCGTPDMLALNTLKTTPVVVAKTEDVIECEEAKPGGDGQLYAAMLLTAGTAILKRVFKQLVVPEETVTVRGLLINRQKDCSICQLEVKPFGEGYPFWSRCVIHHGAQNKRNLLWTLDKLLKLSEAH